ncbi:hypothetical protein BDN70DRAFT_918193 [Pholiota conissans]|uniref:MIT domain-containing protein n=1 Tax=Pholiota conissans TaxID=109636 RepID=A0A9P5ZBR8_9AGAR|nr:hypothetical protein BDN70DRAFT_918193 [Pholiota conissans]
MPTTDTPMNTAHQHAANADDYLAKGLIVLAAEEHFHAAEAYMSAIDRSNDESAKRTLRMLYNEHCKAAKELQRKIDQLKLEGKDPNLPQKPELPKAVPPRYNSNPYIGSSRVNTASPPPIRPMTDSQNTGDESFMLLGGQRSDPGDAFNQFWNIMQGMLDNLSQPVAFATVPLNAPEISPAEPPYSKSESRRRDEALSSDTDVDEPIFSKFTRKIGIGRENSRSGQTSSSRNRNASTGAQKPSHNQDDESDFEDFLEDGDDLSGSFFLIPSGPETSPSVLKKENDRLKAEVSSMKARLEGAEQILRLRKEQDMQLRDSIFMATKEAQRALGASAMLQRPAPPLDFSSLNINVPAVPIPGINTGREAQYARRVKELEDELRLMRVENEKNKMMIAKFRERWEKLKDSAKRKKEAKAAAEAASTGVRERIIEEPEAEEELDETIAR